MGATSDMVLVSMSTVGFLSSGLYVLVTFVEIRGAGGLRPFLRQEARRLEEFGEDIEAEVSSPPVEAD